MKKFGSLVLLMVVMFGVSGCSKSADDEAALNPHETGEISLEQKYAMPGPAEVTIPDDVKGSWKSIKVEVTDSESGKKETLEIDLGTEKEIGESGLKIRAVSFLPAFQMDGTVVTSRSNELENPAAQILVMEGDNQIFKGWLFTLYPTTHAFTHPKYSLTLLEGVPLPKG